MDKRPDIAKKKKVAKFAGKAAGHLGLSMVFDFFGHIIFVAVIVGMILCLFNCG